MNAMAAADTSTGRTRLTLTADTSEFDAAFSELKLYVDRFPAEARRVFSEIADNPTKLYRIEPPVTVGARAIYPIKPSQWLLDLLAACRAGDFNWIVQNVGSHD